jgi:hypothetical protein
MRRRRIFDPAGMASMTRVLVIYYSQTWETAEIAKLFSSELAAAGAEVLLEPILPRIRYLYPWKSIRRFFNQMPNAILGVTPPIAPPSFAPSDRFDLVVLCYPVWFLSPAPPVQAFFKLPHAAVLGDTDVITLSVSRAAWQRASIAMKSLLARAGARHVDNIAVTHQGSPIATLVSTPRTLLFGRRDSLLKVFPRAGVADADIERVRSLASSVGSQLASHVAATPYLRGAPAVSVNRAMAIPELLAWYCFRVWARAIDAIGRRFGRIARGVAVLGFAIFLVVLIIVGLPLTLLGTLILAPVIRKPLDAYVASLAAPSGAAAAGLSPVAQKPSAEEMQR